MSKKEGLPRMNIQSVMYVKFQFERPLLAVTLERPAQMIPKYAILFLNLWCLIANSQVSNRLFGCLDARWDGKRYATA
jgi:hypothetical protein